MATAAHRREFAVMGTTAEVVLIGGGPELAALAEARLRGLEQRWSRFLPDSEISALNARPGVPVVVSAETFDLIASAIEAWRLTGGAFDPTVGAVMVAAGYDRPFDELRSSREPSPAGGATSAPLRSYGPAPGPAAIVAHPYPRSVELPVGVQLDLGGIAKGAAADLVAAELLAAGVDGCCVNLGGDARLAGQPPRAEGWQIALDHVGPTGPTGPNRIGLAEGAVCTSTKLRRRWSGPAGAEHHLRDPRTGAAIETGVASVTVIGARAAQAEVLTKAMFAAGVDRSVAIATATGVTGLIVDDRGATTSLPGLEPFVSAGHPLVAAGAPAREPA